MSALHISLENIVKTYRRNSRILDDLCLDVPPGTFVGIRGPSGSGKSTLARIAAGLEQPDRGAVYWDGRDILRDKKRHNGQVQLLPQNAEAALNPLKTVQTLLEEVCSLPQAKRYLPPDRGRNRKENIGKQILTALERVELSPYILGYRPPELSGGMNQRLLLTRILLGHPDCLILDEPGAGLDASAAAGLYQLIRNLKQSRELSGLIISHEPEVLDFLCDKIHYLEDGCLK